LKKNADFVKNFAPKKVYFYVKIFVWYFRTILVDERGKNFCWEKNEKIERNFGQKVTIWDKI